MLQLGSIFGRFQWVQFKRLKLEQLFLIIVHFSIPHSSFKKSPE
jgi:hypothetical protein